MASIRMSGGRSELKAPDRAKLNSFQEIKPLLEKDVYKLILTYRWLSLIPPAVGVLTAPKFNPFILASFALAILWSCWQTVRWRNRVEAWQSGEALPTQTGLAADIIFCAVLIAGNGIWSSPFYLYGLGPIFSSAFFYGFWGAMRAGIALSSGYLLALGSSLMLTGLGGNWVVSVTNVTGFVLCSLLFGYQSAISFQLKEKTGHIEALNRAMQEQNEGLARSNQNLEIVRSFSQEIQAGRNSHEVFTIALNQLCQVTQVREVALGILEQNKENEGEAFNPDYLVREWVNYDPIKKSVQYSNSAPGGLNLTPDVLGEALCAPEQAWEAGEGWFFLHSTPPLKGEPLVLLAVKPVDSSSLQLLLVLGDLLGKTLQNLSRTQALAVEAERARLAMDMHDAVTQSLFGLAYNLDACVKLLGDRPETIRPKLVDLRSTAFSTLSSLRRIIYDLWEGEEDHNLDGPEKEEEAGPILPFDISRNKTLYQENSGVGELVLMLHNHIKNVSVLYPFILRQELGELPSNLSLSRHQVKALYRVAQEALANAAKHAAPTRVSLFLKYGTEKQELELVVEDNGCGFNSKALSNGQAGEHYGLGNMQRRVEEAGGNFEIFSAPGRGTRVVINLKLKQAALV